MAALRRVFKPVLYATGGCLVVGSLLGARLLTQGEPGGDPKPKTAAPVQAVGGGGPVVIGWVDSKPSPVRYGLPAAMQAGLVEKVYVNPGDKVKVGDPLIKFDSSIQQANLDQAQAARNVANAKLQTANDGKVQHEKQVEAAKVAVSAAELKRDLAQEAYHVGYKEKLFNWKSAGSVKTPEDEKRLVEKDVDIFQLSNRYRTAEKEIDVEKARLNALMAVNPQFQADEAAAGVKQADAAIESAKAALTHCTVKAKEAGTIEQVRNVSPGSVLGVGNMDHAAVWLVPDGPRIVHAELEAEFAHRVGPDAKGKTVTIYDNSDSKLTYKGVILRIGDAFLRKRVQGDPLTSSDSLVLEVEVEVTDPAPPGQSPLRVGQKVRVSFGQ